MKLRIIYTILCSLILVSCNNKPTNNKDVLSVTIEPQRFFLETLVGDKYTVNCVTPKGANPESFDPTPSQLIEVSKSKMYFTVGSLGVEHLLVEKLKSNSPDIKYIDCSTGISLIEGHDHANCGHDDHHHDHGHAHAGTDPHIWSSPASAKIMIQNMYNALIDFDKNNKDYYETNYNKLIETIDSTDQVIRNYLEKASNKSFIIYHPALSYFANEYGLLQYSIEKDGKSPTPTQLAEMIDNAKKEGVKTVFIQKEFDVKNAETIAKSINARTFTINLLNYNWAEELINIAKTFSDEQ